MLNPIRIVYVAMCNKLIERGIITASSKREARQQLKERGCEQIRLKPEGGILSRLFGKK